MTPGASATEYTVDTLQNALNGGTTEFADPTDVLNGSSNLTISSEPASDTNLNLGANPLAITNITGFDSVSITGGEVRLLGVTDDAGVTTNSSFTVSGVGNILYLGQDSLEKDATNLNVNGTVSLAESGTLQLEGKGKFKLTEVNSSGGSIKVGGGEVGKDIVVSSLEMTAYKAGANSSLTTSGEVKIGAVGMLEGESGAKIDVTGTGNVSVSDSFNFQGALSNSGNVALNGDSDTLSGHIYNDHNLTAKNLQLTQFGDEGSSNFGTIKAENFNVSGNFTNSGSFEVTEALSLSDHENNGAFLNEGTLTVAGITSEANTTFRNQNGEGGKAVLKIVEAEGVDAGVIKGSFINGKDTEVSAGSDSSGSPSAGVLSFESEKRVENQGSIEGISIQVAGTNFYAHSSLDNKKVGFLNEGTANLEKLTVAAEQASDIGFYNKGNLSFKTLAVNSGTADLTQGTLNATDAEVTVGNEGTVGAILNLTDAAFKSVSVEANGNVDVGSLTLESLVNKGIVAVTGNYGVKNTNNAGTINLPVSSEEPFVLGEGQTFVNAGNLNGANEIVSAGATFTNDGGTYANGEKTVNQILVQGPGNFVNQSGELKVINLMVGDESAEPDAAATKPALTLTAGSTLNVDNLAASQAVINIDGGKLAITSNVTKDSTINLSEGTFDLGVFTNNVLDGDKANFSGNTINVTGNAVYNGDDKDTFESQLEGLTTLKAEQIDNSNTYVIGAGGMLDVEKIDSFNITLNGGVLKTTQDQLFDMNMPDTSTESIPDGEQRDDLLKPEDVGAPTVVASKFDKNTLAQGPDGKANFVFTDASYNLTAVDFLEDAYGRDNYTANYTGEFAGVFTLDTAKNVVGDKTKTFNLILSGTTLNNYYTEDGAEKGKGNALVIGQGENNDTTNYLNASIGFQGISGVSDVTITDGYTLALVGTKVAEGESQDSATSKLLGSTSGDGQITVNGNGTLILGSYHDKTVGMVGAVNVETNGLMQAQTGQFEVTNLKVDGKLDLNNNAEVKTYDLTGKGTIHNYAGKFIIAAQAPAGGDAGSTGTDLLDDADVSAAKELQTAYIGEKGSVFVADVALIQNAAFNTAGKSDFTDLTVAAGQTHTTSGEQGGSTLTVAGTYTNNGTAKWEALEFGQDGEKVVNLGQGSSLTVGNFKGAGTVNSQGKLELTADNDEFNAIYNGQAGSELIVNNETLTAKAGSELSSAGKSEFNNLTIEKDAEVSNAGAQTVTGTLNLLEGAEYSNSGTAELGNLVMADASATVNNSGTLKVNTAELNLVGSYTGTNNSEVIGNKLIVNEGGTFYTEGSTKFDELSLEGGSFTSVKDGGVLSKINLAKGTLTVEGAHNINELTVNVGEGNESKDSSVLLRNGTIKIANAYLNGGDFHVGQLAEQTRAADGVANVELMNVNGEINTNTVVASGDMLALGEGGVDKGLAFRAAKGNSGAMLVVNKPAVIGAAGTLNIGGSEPIDSVLFAKDSVTLVNVSGMEKDQPALTLKGHDVTVEDGATLVLTGIGENGDYIVLGDAGQVTLNGWTEDNLYAWDEGSGLDYDLEIAHLGDNVVVTATLSDVRAIYPNIAIPNISNYYMRDKGTNFIKGILKDKVLGVDQKTTLVNSAANLAFAGGAMSVSLNDLMSVVDTAEGRVSMKSGAFTPEGQMKGGTELWVDVLGGKQKFETLAATGVHKFGYDTNTYGFVIGADHKFEAASVILGAALSYDHGSLKSTGDVLKTKNKYHSFGVHGYGAWSPVDNVNVVGTLSYLHNSSRIDQNLSAVADGKAKLDPTTDLVSLGVRGEYNFKVGSANIIPHVGVRYVHGKTKKADTKINGTKVWSNKFDATNTVQFPVGVAVRGDLDVGQAWKVRPQLDVTLIPQAGSSKQRAKLTQAGVTDTIRGEYAGNFATNVNLGIQAEKGAATFGLRYGLTGGNKGRLDHGVKLEARYRF